MALDWVLDRGRSMAMWRRAWCQAAASFSAGKPLRESFMATPSNEILHRIAARRSRWAIQESVAGPHRCLEHISLISDDKRKEEYGNARIQCSLHCQRRRCGY